MTKNDIESRLLDLANRWPVGSVADAVEHRLRSIPRPRQQQSSRRAMQWTGMGVAVAAALAVAAFYVAIVAVPTNLYAQVADSIRKSMSAHMQIVSTNADGSRTVGAIWYSRELGVRGELGDESFIDNGKQQWTWKASNEAPSIVSRRASRDAIAMIADTLQLPKGSDQVTRATESDREIQGQKCSAYKVTVPVGSDSDPHAKKPENRILAWQNELKQIVLVQHEQLDTPTGKWRSTRELTITYDVMIADDKFTAKFPASTRIVDEDRVWTERFAIEKAHAPAESGGLLFAIHELSRCDNGSYYVVSSVRGTNEHLRKHPPKSRRLNLQTSLLDVAEQFCSVTSQQNCHIAPIASHEIDGVHYLWWLAVDRSYFRVESNQRVPQPAGKKMESELGHIRLPLLANYRGELAGSSMVSTYASVDLPKDARVLSLRDVALQVQQDSALSQQGLMVHTFENSVGSYVPANFLTVEKMVKFLQSELDWLSANDELGEANLSGPASTDLQK